MKKSNLCFSESTCILESIIDNIALGIIAFDINGDINLANKLAKINLSIPWKSKENSYCNILEVVAKMPELNNAITKCLNKGMQTFKIDSIEHKGKFLSIIGNPILNGMILTLEDITQKKEIEKSTLKALIKGQEEERKRMAKEIHDGLGPMLSAIKMHVQAIQSDFDSIENNTLIKLETTYKLIDSVASDMRSLSHDLMPKVLEDFGLVEALDSLCRNLSNEKTDILFTQNIDIKRYGKTLELNLFRVAQELIHNSLKHANCEKITLQLLKHSDILVLMVEDNGKGIISKEKKEYGIGLKNIETRTKAIGGVFTLDSVTDIGVTATVEVALY